MILSKICLENFRNYDNLVFNFENGLNIICGRNASGKTNVLEAIFFLGTTRSHRTAALKDLISWGSNGFHIRGQGERAAGSIIIDIVFPQKGKKRMMLNNNPLRRRRDLVGEMPVVFFSPEDLMLVKGDPALRRRFLNILLCQISKRYLASLHKYQRILLERNSALRLVRDGNLDRAVLSAWDEQLVQYGMEIMAARRQAVHKLSDASSRIHREMTGGSEDLRLSYRSNVAFLAREEEMERAYHKKLVERRKDEILQGITLIGPHRDDISISLNSTDLRRYGSQGQSRTCTLSLKLAELELMNSFLGEYPVVLFDDVMSELDGERRRSFLNLLDKNVQSFITTTELGVLESIKERASIFDVEKRERVQ